MQIKQQGIDTEITIMHNRANKIKRVENRGKAFCLDNEMIETILFLDFAYSPIDVERMNC